MAIFGKIRVPSSIARLSQLCLSDNHTRSGNRRLSILPPGNYPPLKGDPVWSGIRGGSGMMDHISQPRCIDVSMWNGSLLRRRNNSADVRLWCV